MMLPIRGHIYYVLQKYDVAKAEYQKVLQLTQDKEIIGFAKHGIESIKEYEQALPNQVATTEDIGSLSSQEMPDALLVDRENSQDLEPTGDLASNSFDDNAFDQYQPAIDEMEELSLDSPFDISADSSLAFNSISDSSATLSDDPFALNHQADSYANSWEEQGELDLPAFWQEDSTEDSVGELGLNSNILDSGTNSTQAGIANSQDDSDSPFAEFDLSTSNSWEIPTEFLIEEKYPEISDADLDVKSNSIEHESQAKSQIIVQDSTTKTNNLRSKAEDNLSQTTPDNWLGPIEAQDTLKEVSAAIIYLKLHPIIG